MSETTPCERMSMPWEQLGIDGHDGLPWEERGWAIFKNGKLGMCENEWDQGSTGRIFRGPRRPREWPLAPISYDDVQKILEICRANDSTFLEAVYEVFGEGDFGHSWHERMKDAPEVRYEGVPEANRFDAPKPEASEDAPVKRKRGRPRKKKAEVISVEE